MTCIFWEVGRGGHVSSTRCVSGIQSRGVSTWGSSSRWEAGGRPDVGIWKGRGYQTEGTLIIRWKKHVKIVGEAV
jgi:hypothetical protein